MPKELNELREKLADIEHQRWGDWQRWLHKIINENGGAIPIKLWKRWNRQIETKYEDLSEEEKESDRHQVDRYLPLIRTKLKEIRDEAVGGNTMKLKIGENELACKELNVTMKEIKEHNLYVDGLNDGRKEKRAEVAKVFDKHLSCEGCGGAERCRCGETVSEPYSGFDAVE